MIAKFRKVAIISETIALAKFLKESNALSPARRLSVKSLDKFLMINFICLILYIVNVHILKHAI